MFNPKGFEHVVYVCHSWHVQLLLCLRSHILLKFYCLMGIGIHPPQGIIPHFFTSFGASLELTETASISGFVMNNAKIPSSGGKTRYFEDANNGRA